MHVKTDKPPSPWMKRTNGRRQVPLPGPGHPAPEDVNNRAAQPSKCYRARTSGPSPGHPAPPEAPEIRTLARTYGATRQKLQ